MGLPVLMAVIKPFNLIILSAYLKCIISVSYVVDQFICTFPAPYLLP